MDAAFKKAVRCIAAVICIFAYGAAAGYAQASLIDDTVGCDAQSASDGWFCNAPTAVVGPGVEFHLMLEGDNTVFDVDIGESSFLLTVKQGYALGDKELVTFDSLHWVGAPDAVIIGIDNFSTNISGLTPSDITWSDHAVVIDLHRTDQFRGNTLSFDLVTSHGVPESSTLAVFFAGLFGLGAAVARKRRKASPSTPVDLPLRDPS